MKREVIVRDCRYDFSARSLMSYRPVLRTLPRSLRRRWLLMRLRFESPRILISSAWRA
jgi:hypothetical protein